MKREITKTLNRCYSVFRENFMATVFVRGENKHRLFKISFAEEEDIDDYFDEESNKILAKKKTEKIHKKLDYLG